jgi:transcriptional regulator with XRE-family HTH domain
MGTATIGSTLRYRRGELGIDQADAAARIGMSRTTFSSYERDLQRPSVEVLPALAQFLDVTIEKILVLYGATCIAGIRPQLEILLSPHDGLTMDPAPIHASTSDGDSSVRESASKESTVSIFDKELSGVINPPVSNTFLEPHRDNAEDSANFVTAKKKKKKKKGKRTKK